MSLFKWLFVLLISYTPFNLLAYEYELTVAAMFHNEGFYLKEWIEYHRMAGVEHFWLYNDRSSDDWQEILQPYIDEGLVDVFQWTAPTTYTNQDEAIGSCRGNHIRAFKDALRRALGTAKWLALIDLDEFILPMKEATVTECLEKYFQQAPAVYVNWRCFGTGDVSIPPGHPILFDLTASSLKDHSRNTIGKSIVRPEFVDIDRIWYIHYCPLIEGSLYVNGDGENMAPFEGLRLDSDGFTHTKFIRINHYVMRDKNYFENVRLARAREGYNGYRIGDIDRLLEHNRDFSLIKNYDLIKFVKKYHPEMYEKFWK